MKSSTLALAFFLYTTAIASPLFTSPAPHSVLEERGANGYYFKNCNDDDRQFLETVLDDVQELAKAAIPYSEPTRNHPAFKAWFGDGSTVPSNSIDDQKINLRYEKFSAFKTNVPKKSVTLDCNRQATCCQQSSTYVACSMQPGDDEVAFCPSFWRWPQKKRLHEYAAPSAPRQDPIQTVYWPVSAVLLHELLHTQYGARDVKAPSMHDPWGKPMDPNHIPAYGHLVCLRLAENDALAARRNADCYAMFATAAYYGIDNWATDPTKLNAVA